MGTTRNGTGRAASARCPTAAFWRDGISPAGSWDGGGGGGVTYVALDHQRGAKVAIKEYLPTAAAHRVSGSILVSPLGHDEADAFRYGLECFLEEARILAKFSDNLRIVGVRSFFQENGTAYFVMDYIEGISFKAYLRSHGGRINEITALQILQPVIYALQDVHQEGLIHRDVTPDNIYIAGDLPAHRPAASGQVKLLDFGAARYSLGDRRRSLDVILKSGYAPKEQYTHRSRQGPYTDVYSVAACLYAAVTGVVPPPALERLEHDELEQRFRCGIFALPMLDNVVAKGLAVLPELRYQTMEEFSQAITQALMDAPSGPPGSNLHSLPPAFPPPSPAEIPTPAVPCAPTALRLPSGGAGAPRIFAAKAGYLYQQACASCEQGDSQRAVRLFFQAARLGDSRAKYCLGECFRLGFGLPQDKQAAFKWYLAAAKGRNTDAFYAVGRCYAAGEGVQANAAQAVQWLKQAVSARSEASAEAQRMLERLNGAQR